MKRLLAGFTALMAVLLMQLPVSADDAKIAKQIIERLREQQQASNLQGFDIGVQVDKGTVTMMGQVAQSEQAMLALDIARRVSGVKLVVNDLYIGQTPAGSAVTQAANATGAETASPAALTANVPAETAQVSAQMPAPTAQPAAQMVVHQAMPQVASRINSQRQQAMVAAQTAPVRRAANQMPVAYAPATSIMQASAVGCVNCGPTGSGYAGGGIVDGGYGDGGYVDGGMAGGDGMTAGGFGGASFDNPSLPGYAWPSYSAHPNYGAVSYPRQYSATAWPYIGPFYPYPQVPLGWRKVMLEWDDGWWWLDFRAK